MQATVRNFTNTELHGSLIYSLELTDFPTDAKRNQQVLINGVLWIYSFVGGLLTWFPLNNEKTTYVHTQGQASLAWQVEHNLGSKDFVLGIYDANNNIISSAGITNLTDNDFTLNFTEETTGRAVLIFSTHLFAPSVTVQTVIADVVNIAGGAVTASSTGLQVNGNAVQVLNNQGYVDHGSL